MSLVISEAQRHVKSIVRNGLSLTLSYTYCERITCIKFSDDSLAKKYLVIKVFF